MTIALDNLHTIGVHGVLVLSITAAHCTILLALAGKKTLELLPERLVTCASGPTLLWNWLLLFSRC